MDTQRSDGIILDGGSVSRRDAVLRLGAGGLAAVLLARGLSHAQAQEGTPAPEGGVPEGVSITPLITTGPLAELPSAPAELYVTRITLEPGVFFPATTTPGPETVLVEAGVLTCVCGAEGHPCSVLRGATGAVEEQPIDQEFLLDPGDVLLQPANVPDSAGNYGSEQLVLLVIDIFPAMEVGTPTS